MEEKDYKFVVKKLNEELSSKYTTGKMLKNWGDFEMEVYQEYVRYERDEDGYHGIWFQKVWLYHSKFYLLQLPSRKTVLAYSKEAFNQYIEALQNLKF